ncbi:MAG: UDP-N-acetylmuramoyl-L-alanyl-D-glutamate--2,6-diaminopimelate ligase [Woeseiaceae bacterium]
MSMPAESLTSIVTLQDLLAGIVAAPPVPISGITADSRLLRPGDVFLACQGATSHGLDYLDQAVAAGISAVVWDSSTHKDPQTDVPGIVPTIGVDGLSGRLGEIANRWFSNPSEDLQVVGVTGTNGKTTVAFLVQQCLQALDRKCGYVGTLGGGMSVTTSETSMTTPPCVELHEQLASFRDEGAGYAAIEVSSHALEQRRVDGVKFDTAIFTNLSRDHIDYHGGMRDYFESKARLFLEYDVRHRIVSLDSEFGAELAERCGQDVIAVSTRFDRITDGRLHVFARSIVATPAGSNISFATSWGDADLSLPLAGEFNVANAAEVLACLLCHDVSLNDACDVLENVCAPPGRMQRVQAATDAILPTVYVDYSHTPASLEAALKALRGHCSAQLWCVFGCGGDRDRGKRSMMGKIAGRLADISVVTSDNPRTEVPAKIIAEILEGMHADTISIEDRGDAIAHAIHCASAGDTILIAGKGHEDYQVIGTETHHFSDVEVATHNLEQRAHSGADEQ